MLKNVLKLSIIFSLHCFVWSQEEHKEDIYYTDSIRKYFFSDSVKTKVFINAYISESINEGNPKNLWEGYHNLTSYYYRFNDTLKVVEYTDTLFSVAKTNNLKVELLKSYHLKNNYLRMLNGLDDPRIIENIFNALEIAQEIGSKIWQCKYYNDIAEYYKLTRDFDNALDFYKKNLLMLKGIIKTPDYNAYKEWGGNYENTCLDVADIYIQVNRIDAAKTYNQMAKSVLDTIEGGYSDVSRYRYMVNELEINLLENDIESANKRLLIIQDSIPEVFKRPFREYAKLYLQGLVSYHEGNFKKAIASFESIDTVRIKNNERLGLFHNDLYKYLYKSHLQLGNSKKSDYYFDLHMESLNGQMDLNNSVNLNLKNTELAKYNEEVSVLSEQRAEQRFYLIAFISGSLISFIGVILFFKKRQKKKLNRLVAEIKSQRQVVKREKIALNIHDEEIKRIIKRLHKLEEKEYYLRIDCTAINLAKKLKTNTTYLSKIINVHYQKNFTTYINDLRIDYVLERLQNDSQLRKYSIQGIANEIGFKSKESFNAAFKKRTGVLPSALIKELKKTTDYQRI
ncbi:MULTISPECIES: AraC family transcriptional regulator [unclassified Allomuricauda]|uniref:helix-turn-helix domain-containing protein n=1 Tax=unclassified Allomuricauda TaxID=2615049 RepID=UPI00273E0853|nr:MULTISPECIES: helix-turn-helix domain-containing protein [unclassified Allomuricauda]